MELEEPFALTSSGKSLTFIVTFRGAYLSSVLCDVELNPTAGFTATDNAAVVVVGVTDVKGTAVAVMTCELVVEATELMFSCADIETLNFGEELLLLTGTLNGVVVLLAARTAARSCR